MMLSNLRELWSPKGGRWQRVPGPLLELCPLSHFCDNIGESVEEKEEGEEEGEEEEKEEEEEEEAWTRGPKEDSKCLNPCRFIRLPPLASVPLGYLPNIIYL